MYLKIYDQNQTKMNCKDTIILENQFVQLRPLQSSDSKYLAYFAQHEPELWKFALVAVNDQATIQNYINLAIEGKTQNREYPFIVFDKTTNEYAGSTRFYDIQPHNKTIQLGYTWYGKKYQGTALNKNCKFLMLQYAFEILNVERVEFRADNNNHRSIAAMKSIGCQVEGILRSNLPTIQNGRRDSIILSILKQEWLETVKTNLMQKLI